MFKFTVWNQASQWLRGNFDRALDNAFRSAVQIKEIEDQYFQGHKVTAENSDYGTSVVAYFATEVNRLLERIEKELKNFQKSRQFTVLENGSEPFNDVDTFEYIIEKLQFVDAILDRYDRQGSIAKIVLNFSENDSLDQTDNKEKRRNARQVQKDSFRYIRQDKASQNLESASRKTGVIPRSFLRTINRIKQDMDPQSGESERKVLNQYRKSRYKTALSIKFLLMLIIIPLLVHQLTKTFFLTPLVDSYFQSHGEIVFINQTMETEAFDELQHFENSLHFQSLLGFRDPLSPEEVDLKLKEKATEISNNYRRQGTNAIANIFADIFSLVSFALVLVTSQQEIEVLKEFIDEIVYGLSDSAKAFLIILFTDMFVGFHSPHGWEVILESIARHFGLPANRGFDFLFIATFPVILDTVFKYWIFRYLNSISPSSVATYRNMNE